MKILTKAYDVKNPDFGDDAHIREWCDEDRLELLINNSVVFSASKIMPYNYKNLKNLCGKYISYITEDGKVHLVKE